MHSSIRRPRLAKSTPLKVKSSFQGLRPAPSRMRSPLMTASEESALASTNGWRVGTFITLG